MLHSIRWQVGFKLREQGIPLKLKLTSPQTECLAINQETETHLALGVNTKNKLAKLRILCQSAWSSYAMMRQPQ